MFFEYSSPSVAESDFRSRTTHLSPTPPNRVVARFTGLAFRFPNLRALESYTRLTTGPQFAIGIPRGLFPWEARWPAVCLPVSTVGRRDRGLNMPNT